MPEQSPCAMADVTARLDGALVLVADDSVFGRELVKAMLQEAGARTILAENGVQALMAVLGHEPDAVVMDVRMPVMDGLEAVRALRAHPGCREVPVLGVCADSGPGMARECLEAGMDAYLPKPVTRAALLDALARLLRRGAAADAPGEPSRTEREPASAAALPTIEGLDLARALDLLAGDARLLERMLARFTQSFEGACAEMEALILRGELREAWIRAHGLKGAAASIGADWAAGLAGELEGRLALGDAARAERALAQLGPVLHDLFTRIAHALDGPGWGRG